MVYCRKTECKYCNKKIDIRQLNKHEATCLLSPKNIKYCPACSGIITSVYKPVTCSHACANSYFRSGPDNPNWKESCYTTTCFYHHEHKCVICDEENIVEVHHFDCNKDNNEPDNLIPLCSTHHRYMHSRFKKLISSRVVKYRDNFRKNTE